MINREDSAGKDLGKKTRVANVKLCPDQMPTPRSAFQNLDLQTANDIATQFGSPLYLLDGEGVMQRFSDFKKNVKKLYRHSVVSISYKTNFLPSLLMLLHELCDAHAEVVSGIEFEEAQAIRKPGQMIVFNGPMKTQSEIEQALTTRDVIINCDHEGEIDAIEKIARKHNKKVGIGLRVYFRNTEKMWNRFGFGIDADKPDFDLEFQQLINRIMQSPYIKIAGLHAHIGTHIRDLKQFNELSKQLRKTAEILRSEWQIELSWIDVGGGLAGISPQRQENNGHAYALPDLKQYANAIIQPILPYLQSTKRPCKLIFEPGRTIFEAYGALLTRVVGDRTSPQQKLENKQALICDVGINMLATSHVYDFPIHYFKKDEANRLSYLYGPTCNQQDQLHSPLLLPKLSTNDLLLFYGVGSYCMAFSFSFIRLRPGVIFWHKEATQKSFWLRKHESLTHINELNVMPNLSLLRMDEEKFAC